MVPDIVTRITYQGDGATTVFPYPFKIRKKSDIKLFLISPDGSKEQLAKDYYIDDVIKAVIYPGYPPNQTPLDPGLIPQPLQPGWKLLIQRQVEFVQDISLMDQYPFKLVEEMGDNLEMQIQDLKSSIDDLGNDPDLEEFEKRFDEVDKEFEEIGAAISALQTEINSKPDSSSHVSGQIAAHNSSTEAHGDIRQLIADIQVGGGGGDADLSDYFTKTEVNALVTSVDNEQKSIIIEKDFPTASELALWFYDQENAKRVRDGTIFRITNDEEPDFKAVFDSAARSFMLQEVEPLHAEKIKTTIDGAETNQQAFNERVVAGEFGGGGFGGGGVSEEVVQGMINASIITKANMVNNRLIFPNGTQFWVE